MDGPSSKVHAIGRGVLRMSVFKRFERALLQEEYKASGLPSPVQGSLEIHHLVEKKGDAIINLSIMTDQTPPPVVRIAAAEQALRGGYIKNALFVRKMICDFYERERGVVFDPDKEIFLTTGSQTGLDSAFKLLIDPGDEVLIPEPEYATYEPMIYFYGGHAAFAPLTLQGNQWAFDLETFEKAISPKTKLVVISNPNNPAGYIYRKEELQEIVRLVRKNDCWLLSDEIWSLLLLREDIPFTSMAVFDDIRDRLVVTFSSSKAFGMSGYRTGAIMGPPEFMTAIDQVVRFVAQAAPTIGQVAFAKALEFDKTAEWIEQRKAGLRKRVKETVAQMNAFKKVQCAEPESGVFLFPRIADYRMTSLEFAKRLVEEQGVYVIPGYFYGRHCDGYVRISLSVPETDYLTGMERFFKFLEDHD